MKKTNDLIAKIIYNTAVSVAKVSVNSVCYFKFYQEKLNSQTEVLKKYHDKKNS